MNLIGVDVGGTFTDLVYFDTDSKRVSIHKLPTTVEDPSQGIVAGVVALCQDVGIAPSEVDYVFHGTTTATNALLENDGARTGMLTTHGFRDVIHIARHQRPQNYSIMQEIPWQDRALVQRRHRKTVRERLTAPHGEVFEALDEAGVRQAVRELKDAGVDSIAVCFLFSYLNPDHEERARAIVLEEHPDAFVTTSSSIFPQFREFERFTTAAINAFVGPRVSQYVRHLKKALGDLGINSELHIMRSNGGVSPADVAASQPVTLLLSGPAAGVLGGAWAGNHSGRQKLITFDVGGTSADIGIVTERGYGEAGARDTWIAGFPVMVPMINISTIGAGGGSIAYVDDGGAFRVGPKSAGAVPGPAAYGKGGQQPTVTDAHVALGRLDPDSRLGGNMTLDVGQANQVIDHLAGKLGLDRYQAANGVLTILNNNMANATRAITVQKGYDPREFSLVAFGGAGPLHAVEVAHILGIREVIVPEYPGITSAIGLLTTDLKYDAIATQFTVNTAPDLERLESDAQRLTQTVTAQLRANDFADDQISVERGADCRYVGQGYELRVPLPDGNLADPDVMAQVWDTFHQLHRAEYGHAFLANPIELVNLRVAGIGRTPKITATTRSGDRDANRALLKTAPVHFEQGGEIVAMPTAFYDRDQLPVGHEVAGPAILMQRDTTTVLPPYAHGHLEEDGNFIIQLEA